MSESDSTTFWVNLTHIKPDLIDGVECLTREGFIEFVDVDLVLADAGTSQQLGDGEGRANTHDLGWDAYLYNWGGYLKQCNPQT